MPGSCGGRRLILFSPAHPASTRIVLTLLDYDLRKSSGILDELSLLRYENSENSEPTCQIGKEQGSDFLLGLGIMASHSSMFSVPPAPLHGSQPNQLLN